MRASNYTPVDAVKKLHEELDKLFAGKTFSGQGKNKPLNIFDFEFPTDFGNDEDVDTVAAAAPFILVKAAGWSIDTVSTDDAALGQKNAAFAWKYTVRDTDGDTLTVTEKLDGKITATRTGVASGTALTFEQTASAAGFQKILNGNHTITVEVSDGKETVSTSATFTKAVHAASVTLAEPLAVEGDITVAVLQVTGSIPDDAKFKAEVTNNALDSSPVWQDATTEVKKGVNIVFENKTATNGAAFNFRVSVERGESGEGGYIEAVSGAFQ